MFIKSVRSQRGQVLMLFALGVIALFAIVGLAIDGGNAFADRRNAQNAADNAVFAAALKKAGTCANNPNCALASFDNAGYAIAQKNGYTNNVNGDTVQVLWPPAADFPPDNAYAGNPEYLQVIIYSSFDTYFARVIGIPTMQNRVSAIVHVKDSVVKPLYDGAAIVALAPHGDGMFDVNGNAQIHVTGGGFLVNSDYDGKCPHGALQVGSNAGDPDHLDVPNITVVGNACGTDPNITTTAAKQWQYPVVEYILPEPECAANGGYDKATKSLSPGYYSTFPPKAVGNDKPILFKKGVYCIDGGFALNGGEDWYSKPGEGVLFYFKSCSGNKCNVTFNGNSSVNLEALGDGSPYPGLLFYFATDPNCDPVAQGGGCRTITINGDNNTDFTGTILAPDAYIKVDGGTDDYGMEAQVIGYNVGVTGTAKVNIIFDEDNLLKLPTSPSIELMR